MAQRSNQVRFGQIVFSISLKVCCLTLSGELTSSSFSACLDFCPVVMEGVSSCTGLRRRIPVFPGTALAFAACLPALSTRFSSITDIRGFVGDRSLLGEVNRVESLLPGIEGSHWVKIAGRVDGLTAMRRKGDASADVNPVVPVARIPGTGPPLVKNCGTNDTLFVSVAVS